VNARTLGRGIARELAEAGITDPEFEAELLVRATAGLSRAEYFADKPVADGPTAAVELAAGRRIRREPASYITGTREFYGIEIAVGPGVLVPRPETEMLVDAALAELGPHSPAPSPDGAGEGESSGARRRGAPIFVDVGTGSGCVAVALAIQPAAAGAMIVGIDVSNAALCFARRNRDAAGARVALVKGDLLEGISRADIVLANLPYIPAGEIDQLEPEVSRWEPRVALDGGEDGFVLIRRLIDDCADRVRPRLLALEVGFGQAATVATYAAERGAAVSVAKDLSGIERVVSARWA
jgi:release factor glutamine methyltransferase